LPGMTDGNDDKRPSSLDLLGASACGVPVFGLVIAGAGVYIAWQQKRIADIRLRHELYDRRFKVYEAAKTLLVAHQTNGKLSGDEYIAYRRGTADAVFLLDAGVVGYLDELRRKAERLLCLSGQQDELRNDISQEARYRISEDDSNQIETWLAQQFDILIAKFKPSMQLDEHYGVPTIDR
jgi:hypothetical protein